MNISVEDIYDIWLDITKKVLESDLSSEEKTMIYEILNEGGELWKSGKKIILSDGRIMERRKSSRTMLVVNFIYECGMEVDERMLPISVLMDVIVNAADEASDFDYSKTSKNDIYKNNVRFGVGWSLLLSYLSENIYKFFEYKNLGKSLSTIFDRNLINYAVRLSLIPVVERKTYEKILKSNNIHDEIKYSLRNYTYRSHDIDIFSSIFIESPELFDEKNILYETLRYLRALDILSKDLYDLEYDIEKQDAYTPLVAIYKKHGVSGVIKYVGILREKLTETALEEIDNYKYENIKKTFVKHVSDMFDDFV